MKWIKNITGTAVALLYPQRCPVCDDIVSEAGEKICLSCLKTLQPIAYPWCECCGKGVEEENSICEECLEGEHRFDRGRILYDYQSVLPSVYRLKYKGRREYAEFFGEEMAFGLRTFVEGMAVDGIVPVPLHRKRQKKRGYNQSVLLAKQIGNILKIPVYEDFMKRVKNTRPLKNLNPFERQNNLKKAFIIPKNDVKLKIVLIVDDIYTTGSTIDEMATVLKENGVKKVYFIALAGSVGNGCYRG